MPEMIKAAVSGGNETIKEKQDRKKLMKKIFFILLTSVLIFIIIAYELYVFNTDLMDKYDEWEADGHKMRSFFLLNIGYLAPLVTICVILTFMYKRGKTPEACSTAHREKALITAIVALLTYAVVIPVIIYKKDNVWDEKEVDFINTVCWLVRTTISFGLIITYQYIRSRSEDVGKVASLDESDDPDMDNYDDSQPDGSDDE